jgi:hypothetical protein
MEERTMIRSGFETISNGLSANIRHHKDLIRSAVSTQWNTV